MTTVKNGGAHSANGITALYIATGLATQNQCAQMQDCIGIGKARKLAEIIGATVWPGELSLNSAVLAGDSVTSHDDLGRNR